MDLGQNAQELSNKLGWAEPRTRARDDYKRCAHEPRLSAHHDQDHDVAVVKIGVLHHLCSSNFSRSLVPAFQGKQNVEST